MFPLIRRRQRNGANRVTTETGSEMTTPMRVLVVEDDRASRSALTALLKLIGCEPLPARTVAEGIRLLDKKPHCLILDLMLPDGNGGALLAYVRQHKLPICVAVTTGSNDWEAMIAHSPSPPDAIFPKPLNFESLTSWLNVNCKGS